MAVKTTARKAARINGASLKLAEALILRADCQKRIEQLKARLLRVAKVQEGDKPAEDPAALLVEFNRLVGELQQLIQRINRTNSSIDLEKGIAELQHRADELAKQHRELDARLQAANWQHDLRD